MLGNTWVSRGTFYSTGLLFMFVLWEPSTQNNSLVQSQFLIYARPRKERNDTNDDDQDDDERTRQMYEPSSSKDSPAHTPSFRGSDAVMELIDSHVAF